MIPFGSRFFNIFFRYIIIIIHGNILRHGHQSVAACGEYLCISNFIAERLLHSTVLHLSGERLNEANGLCLWLRGVDSVPVLCIVQYGVVLQCLLRLHLGFTFIVVVVVVSCFSFLKKVRCAARI